MEVTLRRLVADLLEEDAESSPVQTSEMTRSGEPDDEAQRWARSGAMWLTGRADGPPLSPGWTAAGSMELAAQVLAELSCRTGRTVSVDGPALLGERAALGGHSRAGRTSAGGSCHLLRSADGWLAVNLARPDDVATLPAWLGDGTLSSGGADLLSRLGEELAHRSSPEVLERAALLGLPIAGLAEPRSRDHPGGDLPWRIRVVGPERERPPIPLVVDLSSLWAGPLCANLVGLSGARVVKVESRSRPDGARLGGRRFFDLLHGGHEAVALPFDTAAGRRALHALLRRADLVIDSSRPRAMRHLGVDPAEVVDDGTTWISITAYGIGDADVTRVGFGDDVAIAAGFHAGDADEPLFCADAAADPITGLLAAVASLASLASTRSQLIDVSMCDCVRWAMGTHRSDERTAEIADERWELPGATGAVPVAPPRAREATGAAPELGADTAKVLAELGQAGV